MPHPTTATLEGVAITVRHDGRVIGAFYAGDHFGLDRLRSWLRQHKEVVLTNEACEGFTLKREGA